MTGPADMLLEAKRLSAGYGGLAAVREIDLTLREGEVVSLLGANGAGKTTTLLTLAGALPAIAGEVAWCGAATRAPLSRRTGAGLGLIMEERSVFSKLTTEENLKIGRGSVSAALEIFPELEPHMKRRAGVLSGGQQQMLTLARALAARPRALLIDELSLGLAPMLVDRVLGVVRDAAAAGVGVLLVEQHVRRALEASDRAYVMQRGRIVESSTSKDLLGRIAEIERMYLGNTGLGGSDELELNAVQGAHLSGTGS